MVGSFSTETKVITEVSTSFHAACRRRFKAAWRATSAISLPLTLRIILSGDNPAFPENTLFFSFSKLLSPHRETVHHWRLPEVFRNLQLEFVTQ